MGEKGGSQANELETMVSQKTRKQQQRQQQQQQQQLSTWRESRAAVGRIWRELAGAKKVRFMFVPSTGTRIKLNFCTHIYCNEIFD